MNGADCTGFGRAQFTIRNGRRASAANAYLRPASNRPNLTVRTDTTALGVTMRGTRAAGIRVMEAGRAGEILAEREIILCGGVFGSPQLLMLSGIGPAQDLRAHGIAPLIDLPVGRNLRDHLTVGQTWARREPGPFDRLLRLDRVALAMARAWLLRDGPATTMPLEVIGFVRSQPDLTVPDFEFMVSGGRPQDARPWIPGLRRAPAPRLAVRSLLLHPRSHGTVTLRSADPLAPARIAFNFLSQPEDLPALRHACRLAQDIVRRSPMEPFRGDRIAPAAGADSDAEIDAWIRATAITLSHPSGTCAMGRSAEFCAEPRSDSPWRRAAARCRCLSVSRYAFGAHQCRGHGRS